MSDSTQGKPVTHVTVCLIHPETQVQMALFDGRPMVIVAPKRPEEMTPNDACVGLCPDTAQICANLSEMFANMARYYNNTPAVEVPVTVEQPQAEPPKRKRRKKKEAMQ